MERKWCILTAVMAIFGSCTDANAQFNTIVDRRSICYELLPKRNDIKEEIDNKTDTIIADIDSIESATLSLNVPEPTNHRLKDRVRKKHLDVNHHFEALPDLTINNLVLEIRKNGIKHEKVVLAQAILETGWFTSSVCRNKNNLFGLTNPRTGEYYEFDHWTESVKAYYTKVQYRYKGGNYLLWLDKIGYAEDKTYVQSLIKLMRQYFM